MPTDAHIDNDSADRVYRHSPPYVAFTLSFTTVSSHLVFGVLTKMAHNFFHLHLYPAASVHCMNFFVPVSTKNGSLAEILHDAENVQPSAY